MQGVDFSSKSIALAVWRCLLYRRVTVLYR